jgi:hypothetical protein
MEETLHGRYTEDRASGGAPQKTEEEIFWENKEKYAAFKVGTAKKGKEEKNY